MVTINGPMYPTLGSIDSHKVISIECTCMYLYGSEYIHIMIRINTNDRIHKLYKCISSYAAFEAVCWVGHPEVAHPEVGRLHWGCAHCQVWG